MKLSWPKMIIASFALFMVFILVFVFLTLTDKRFDHELVTENYYGKELHLQKELDQQKKAYTINANPDIYSTSEGIIIQFPPKLDSEEVKGTVSLYRPSDQRLDFEIPISLSSSLMLIPDSLLVGGRWDITVNWQYQGEPLLYKKQLFY